MSDLHPILTKLIVRYPHLAVCGKSLNDALQLLKSTFDNGGKVLLCGNGGSNADCDHIAAELMKSFLHPRPIPHTLHQKLHHSSHPFAAQIAQKLQGGLPAISLGAHTAIATAITNDTCGEMIFAQQLYALGKPGDLLWGISTSGNAVNVLHAASLAKALDMHVLGLTGEHGGQLRPLCDVVICAPANRVDFIQELHLPIYHALCAAIESCIF